MTEEEHFFIQLLKETKSKFVKSPIYTKQTELGRQWNYSVCGTPIQKNKQILLGINWGVDGDHEAQKELPHGRDIQHYNFIQRSQPFLEKYLAISLNAVNFNYTNLCFFRSPNASYLSLEDYQNSLPLFKLFADLILPPWIFSLGNSNYQILEQLGQLTNIKKYFDSEKKYYGVTGKLWSYDFYSVPHPNARVKSKSRNEIWELIGKHII
jgi:hypothetical protein